MARPEQRKRDYFVKGDRVGLARSIPNEERMEYENWLDSEMQRDYNYRPHWSSFAEYHQFFRDPNRPPPRFFATVVRLADQRPIGSVSLAPAHREPDLSISLYRPFRGLGYGTEAYQLAVAHILTNFDVEFLFASTREDNTASMRALEKTGFERVPEKDEMVDDNFGKGQVRWLAFQLRRTERESGNSPER